MALKRLEIDGYGQLELNNVTFRRTGAIEAQCALDGTDFASTPAENGMLLAVDKVNRVVKMPSSSETLPIALNYTSEHMYDATKPGLKNFKLEKDTFLPRMGYLTVGDTFTTNCVGYDSSEFAAESNLITALDGIKTTDLYGAISTDGSIKLTATAPTVGPKLLVIAKTTMPDGQLGVKLQVVTA